MSTSPIPPEASQSLIRLARLATRPLERFLKLEAASGIVLIVTAGIALIWANSPWAAAYHHLWHLPVGLRLGDVAFERPLEWFVNDGLMVIFFFVIGLEIRRELDHGELSEFRRAILPAAAALGGMVVPALIYLLIASGEKTRSGWGVPMATDIAFAIGVLTLLGKRVPPALRVLLLALAVIDDLGAIVVIGFFYSSGLHLSALGIALVGVVSIVVLQRLGVRPRAVYIAPAIVVWAGVAASGIHPTIAGVVIGLLTPVNAWLGTGGFLAGMQRELSDLAAAPVDSHRLASRLQHVNAMRREAMSPVESLIEMLHPWVAFAIMPIFALANAGVTLGGVTFEGDSMRALFGVAMGLLLGKPIGVVLACVVLLKLKIAVLPVGLSTRHLIVLGTTAGIGFTMALFVSALAFSDASLLAAGKLGILGATFVASITALVLGRVLLKTPEVGAAITADEAESSTTL